MNQVEKTKPISIFNEELKHIDLNKTMRDIASLSGVLNDLHTQQIYQSPSEVLRFLRIVQLLNEEALGLAYSIADEESLYYRYLHRFNYDEEPPSIERVSQIVNTLAKHSWISKQSKQVKVLDRGKRMIDSLIRLANESLAYHMQDDLTRALFQACRDAELSKAYDDQGISGGNNIASMIQNIEEATEQIELRQLEFLADKNALPELKKIHALMMELDEKMNSRLQRIQSVEGSSNLSRLIERGIAALSKGTRLSLGTLNKYKRFIMMKNTPLTANISPEKVRQFIINMYDPPIDSTIPNAHDLLSFMEQQIYEDEAMDGLWIPIKFTSPISKLDIEESVDYLENYESQVNFEEIDEEMITYTEELIEEENIHDAFTNASWQMTKAIIDTEHVENYLQIQKEAEIEQLIVELGSSNWGDSIRTMLTVSALVGNRDIDEEEKIDVQSFEKEWEWIDDDDRKYIVRQRTTKFKPVNGDAKS